MDLWPHRRPQFGTACHSALQATHTHLAAVVAELAARGRAPPKSSRPQPSGVFMQKNVPYGKNLLIIPCSSQNIPVLYNMLALRHITSYISRAGIRIER